jgi:hypothetical protein
MIAADGKMRNTDVADTEQTLRLIQSIPSPNAEPFKTWLAQVGNERINETADPELAIGRDPISSALPPHLSDLLNNARQLTPAQIEALNQFIRMITEKKSE